MISLIVAMANHSVIGKDNQLPWHLPEDLRYFKAITMGHPVIMGRKTFESIGKALPGRQNIVVSTNRDYAAPSCLVVTSLNDALEVAEVTDETFVIGGAKLFETALPIAEKLYITRIYADIDGNTFFPKLDSSEWQEARCEKYTQQKPQGLAYAFLQYVRK